jgi:hypothetical protein
MRRHLSVALFILFSLPLAGQTFPQRVAAGDVRSDSIVLWARLRPTIKDDFLKALINANLAQLGYDPIGLAGSPINATLLQGDYIAVHAYGWSEFTIDPISQQLDVTTWGVPAYTRAQMQANAQSIIAVKPVIISRFTVTPR